MALPLQKQMKNICNFLKVFEYAMRLRDIPPKVSVSQTKHFKVPYQCGQPRVVIVKQTS